MLIVDIKLLFREQMTEITNELKKEGKKIWSISRLNNFNTCPRQYYLTYISKAEQKQGIYSMLGTALHTDCEDLYNGVTQKLTPTNFNSEWSKAELFGINFPSELIKGNYKKDLDTCYKYYEKMDGDDYISELGFLLHIDDNNVILGYIDLVELLPNGKARIFDFKSSAMFKDKKLKESGRQLAVYQIALEQLYGLDIVDNAWIMCKYVDIQVADNKPILAVQNKDIVKKAEKQIKKLMMKNGMDDMLSDLYMSKCAAAGSLEPLPQNILDQIKISTHIKSYDITDEVEEETMNYIKSTIAAIESIDEDDKTLWQCESDKFFCENLCGFYPKHCNKEN